MMKKIPYERDRKSSTFAEVRFDGVRLTPPFSRATSRADKNSLGFACVTAMHVIVKQKDPITSASEDLSFAARRRFFVEKERRRESNS